MKDEGRAWLHVAVALSLFMLGQGAGYGADVAYPVKRIRVILPVPGYEANTWFGLLAPAKTPRHIVARLNQALVTAIRAPEIRAQLATQGADPVGSSPEEFAAHIRVEFEKYARMVKLSGARVD